MNAVGHGECEHVALHKCIRDRNKGKIFINPKFIIRKSHCDTPTQCVTWASLAHFQEVQTFLPPLSALCTRLLAVMIKMVDGTVDDR
jgi:hypothetical protein